MSLKTTIAALKNRFTGDDANNALSLGGTPAAEWAKKSDVQGFITASGGGNVVGPLSSALDHFALFADATGKLLKDGGPIADISTKVYVDTAKAEAIEAAATDATTKADAAQAAAIATASLCKISETGLQSRGWNTTYTNNLGRPMIVQITGSGSGSGTTITGYVNGSPVMKSCMAGNSECSITLFVPNGASYSASRTNNGNLLLWNEVS